MVLVCAADDFQKILENAENEPFFKKSFQSVISKNQGILVFFKSAKWVCNLLRFILKKKLQSNAYFLQKVDFCIFEPKKREVIENSCKAPLNFSPLQCTYLNNKSFQYH